MSSQSSPNLLRFPNKKLRAEVIARYVFEAKYRGVVCFSCGNASGALKKEGLFVVDISPRGELLPNVWWSPEMIHQSWPDLFDATSGHLPVWMMLRIAKRYAQHLGDRITLGSEYEVPTGSGETILCLRWAFPGSVFVPIYSLGPETEFQEKAPLNTLVAQKPALASV